MSGVPLAGSVVVVTGASSGIARATAVALAERGASVVVAARTLGDLNEVVQECESYGVAALAVQTDVSDAEQVEDLGRQAIERFGHFDAWVNGAAVMAYGSIWDIPVGTYRHVIETTLFGTIYGARVALQHFRDRGTGVLVNIASLYGRVTTPYVSPYIVSKYAIRGLSRCLRQETLHLDGVEVCAVLPQAVDTPIFRHAANYTGQELAALPLAADPDRVVRAVLRCIERPKREVLVGLFGYSMAWSSSLLPGVYERLAPVAMDWFALEPREAPPSDGNVFRPRPEYNAIDGGWRQRRSPLRRGAAVLAAAAALTPVVNSWRRGRRAST